jgi:hypothetical protein
MICIIQYQLLNKLQSKNPLSPIVHRNKFMTDPLRASWCIKLDVKFFVCFIYIVALPAGFSKWIACHSSDGTEGWHCYLRTLESLPVLSTQRCVRLSVWQLEQQPCQFGIRTRKLSFWKLPQVYFTEKERWNERDSRSVLRHTQAFLGKGIFILKAAYILR